MLIRNEQMDRFAEATAGSFEERTYLHLHEYFPHHCELLGKSQMLLVIRHGCRKANSYGLTTECCVRSYIEFMCLLGGSFDADILLPWAAEILNDRSDPDQVARGDRLYYRMWEYIDHITADFRDSTGQPTTGRFMDDLRELRRGNEETSASPGMPHSLENVEARIQRLFPAKCAYVGGEAVRNAIAESTQAAKRYGITSYRGVTLFTGMRFLLGAGFDHDLLIPWASGALHDPEMHDQDKKVDKLYAEGVSFLRRWWKTSAGQDLRNVLG